MKELGEGVNNVLPQSAPPCFLRIFGNAAK
jgi:hypothetical protein